MSSAAVTQQRGNAIMRKHHTAEQRGPGRVIRVSDGMHINRREMF